MRCALSPTMDFGSSQQSVRSQALAGEGAERGKQRRARNEDNRQGRGRRKQWGSVPSTARSGGGAQMQEGGQKVYPFADWKQGARAPRKTPRPDPFWCCSDAEAPACAPHPSSARSVPPASWRRRAARRGPRATARAFSPPPLLLREFFLLRGVHWVVSLRFALVARVGRALQRPRRATKRAPTRKVQGGASRLTFDGRRHLRAKKKGRWHGRIM